MPKLCAEYSLVTYEDFKMLIAMTLTFKLFRILVHALIIE